MAALLGEKKRQDNGSLAETEGMPPALRSRREELSDALVRWLTYLSGIAVLFIAAAHVFQPRPTVMASAPIERVQWAEIEKPIPAFALAIPEAENAPAGYAIRRARIGGGRKDILTLGDADSVEPYLHVEIYRPGSEIGRFATPAVTIAGDAEAEAMGPVNIRQETEPLASKFGPLTIVTFDTSNGASRGCLAFVRAYDDPRLAIVRLVLPWRRARQALDAGLRARPADTTVGRQRAESSGAVCASRIAPRVLRATRPDPGVDAEIPATVEGAPHAADAATGRPVAVNPG
jgi:hypothetical protein